MRWDPLGHRSTPFTGVGWLIDPLGDQVFVCRPGTPAERLEEPDSVSADPVLPGFRLELAEIL